MDRIVLHIIDLVHTDKSSLSASELQSLSKPVHWSAVNCSSTDLSLLECVKHVYSGYTYDVIDVIVTCEKCKIKHSCME